MRYSLFEKQKKNITLFIVTTLVFSAIYELYPARPGFNNATGTFYDQPGWRSWADQGAYYRQSDSIANGTFDTSQFTYGLGYVSLGVPFVLLDSEPSSIFSHHRYFVPNLLILFAVAYMTFNLTQRLTQSTNAGILSLALLFFGTLYLSWFVEPWNIHVSDVAIIGVFYIFFRNPDNITNKHLVIAGLLAGWTFSSRYLDLFWLLPIFMLFLIYKPRKFPYFIPGLAVVGLVLVSHLIFLGGAFELPHVYKAVDAEYSRPTWEDYGYNVYDWDLRIISERSYCILFDPQYCLPEKSGNEEFDTWWYFALVNKTPILFSSSIFLIISPFGIFLLLRKFSGEQRFVLISLLVGFVMSWITYTATIWFTSGWTRFFRYEIFWFPVFTVFAVYGMFLIYKKINPKLKEGSN